MPNPDDTTATPYDPNDPTSGEQNPFIGAPAEQNPYVASAPASGAQPDLAPTPEQLAASGAPAPFVPWGPVTDLPAPYAPTPSATSAVDRTITAAPSMPIEATPPSVAFNPYGPPPELQPPTATASGPAGTRDLDQPIAPPAAQQQPAQPPGGNRLVGLLPVDQQRNLSTALDTNADPAARGAAWKALPANVRTETLLHAQGDQIGQIGDLYDSLDNNEKLGWQIVNGNFEAQKQNAEVARASKAYEDQLAQIHAQEVADRARIQANLEQNMQRAQQLANTEIKPNWTAGSVIGAIVGGAIGGFASSATGGRNLFLDSLDRGIDQGLANQRANLENKWLGLNDSNNLLAQEYARTGDMAQAEFVYRQTQYGAALNDIKTEAQKYIPGGTTYAKLSAAYDATTAQQARSANEYLMAQQLKLAQLRKAQADALGADFDQQMKAQKLAQQRAAALAAPVQRRLFTKQQLIAGGFSPDLVSALPDSGLSTLKPDVAHVTDKDISDALEANTKATQIANTKAEIAGKVTANAAAEAKNSAAAPVMTGTADDGTPIIETKPMTNRDGSLWRPPEKFNKMIGDAITVNSKADALANEIAKWGGQSDLVKSPHWQQLQADYHALFMATHGALGIDSFRPGTLEVMKELSGSVDPTSFVRDATTGIQALKRNINEALNNEATAARYDGPPIRFLDTSRPALPKSDDVGNAETAAMAKDSDAPADREFLYRSAHRGSSPIEEERKQSVLDQNFGPRTPEMTHALELGVPPTKLAAIDTLLTAIRNPAAKPAMTAASADAQGQIVKATQAAIEDATAAIATAKKAGDQKAVYAAQDQLAAAKQKLAAMRAAIRAQAALGTLSTDAPDQATRDYAAQQLEAVNGEEIPEGP